MRKTLLITLLIFSNLTFSQIKDCSIQQIQLETYDFVAEHIEIISPHILNRDSLIEVTIYFKKNYEEYKYEFEINFKENEDFSLVYFLLLPENNYNGEKRITPVIHKKLDQFITNKVNDCIKNNTDFTNQDYVSIVFRIPLSLKNIEKAREEVYESLKNQ
ncbi:MAG: hypothetical protein ACSHWW_04305 [Nonlabens sp.]|uniref:hypothetical protein n=1 Tax=Nonlabens sp. TaxID=1888209 RepID=UPI003EFA8EAC